MQPFSDKQLGVWWRCIHEGQIGWSFQEFWKPSGCTKEIFRYLSALPFAPDKTDDKHVNPATITPPW